MRYALARWDVLTRYLDDGRLEIDNKAAERALRGVVLGRKNYLFAGSDAGGERAALISSLISTAKLNGLDPEAYLRNVLARIADHPITRICIAMLRPDARVVSSEANSDNLDESADCPALVPMSISSGRRPARSPTRSRSGS